MEWFESVKKELMVHVKKTKFGFISKMLNRDIDLTSIQYLAHIGAKLQADYKA